MSIGWAMAMGIGCLVLGACIGALLMGILAVGGMADGHMERLLLLDAMRQSRQMNADDEAAP